MTIRSAYYFTLKCSWCKTLVRGESSRQRKDAKKDFQEKMNQHLRDSHNGTVKRRVKACRYCDTILVGTSGKDYDIADRELSRRIREHTAKDHAAADLRKLDVS